MFSGVVTVKRREHLEIQQPECCKEGGEKSGCGINGVQPATKTGLPAVAAAKVLFSRELADIFRFPKIILQLSVRSQANCLAATSSNGTDLPVALRASWTMKMKLR